MEKPAKRRKALAQAEVHVLSRPISWNVLKRRFYVIEDISCQFYSAWVPAASTAFPLEPI
jgi:hypothetical protein